MTIEQRLAKLEKQNRWMKRGGGLALAAVACVVLIAQGKAKELPDLVVRSLTLRDGEGKPRAVLSMEKPNTPSLVLLDQNGTKRVYLLAAQGGRASVGLGAGDGGEGKKPEEVLEEAIKCLCWEIEVAENEVAAAEAAK